VGAEIGRIDPTMTTNWRDSSNDLMAAARCSSTTLLPVLQAESTNINIESKNKTLFIDPTNLGLIKEKIL
jgi:hypothetical protein